MAIRGLGNFGVNKVQTQLGKVNLGEVKLPVATGSAPKLGDVKIEQPKIQPLAHWKGGPDELKDKGKDGDTAVDVNWSEQTYTVYKKINGEVTKIAENVPESEMDKYVTL